MIVIILFNEFFDGVDMIRNIGFEMLLDFCE